PGRLRLAGDLLVEAPAVGELHREAGMAVLRLAHAVDRQDVAVPQTLLFARPELETLDIRLVTARKRLDGDQTVLANVLGLVNVAVGALRDFLENLVLLPLAVGAEDANHPRRVRLVELVVKEEQRLQLVPQLRVLPVVVLWRERPPGILAGGVLGVDQVDGTVHIRRQLWVSLEILLGGAFFSGVNAPLQIGLCPTEPVFQVVVIVVERHERIPERWDREVPLNFVRRRHLMKDMPDRRVRKLNKTS